MVCGFMGKVIAPARGPDAGRCRPLSWAHPGEQPRRLQLIAERRLLFPGEIPGQLPDVEDRLTRDKVDRGVDGVRLVTDDDVVTRAVHRLDLQRDRFAVRART